MRPNFQTVPTNMVMWNQQVKTLCILIHTDNDKDRIQHLKTANLTCTYTSLKRFG